MEISFKNEDELKIFSNLKHLQEFRPGLKEHKMYYSGRRKVIPERNRNSANNKDHRKE